jgi:hypothetical protein
MKVPSWVKPGIWGMVIGAAAWWVVLAGGLGWMSGTAAKQFADNQTLAAVVATATPYCVARFQQQPNAVTSWQALKKSAADYNQTDYVIKGGWAKLSGQKPDSDFSAAVADSCATQLLALTKIDGVNLSSPK